MTRWALLALVVAIVGLWLLSQLPDRRPDLPDTTIVLHGASVVLLPEADPDAVWTFRAPEARFEPDTSVTQLLELHDGARMVAGEVDFTLSADLLVIDRRDDLIADRLDAHLVADGWDVAMHGRDGRNVLVRQDVGRFEVPHIEISGDGIGDSVYQDMSISFDFTDFQAGGPGTIGTSAFIAATDRGDP